MSDLNSYGFGSGAAVATAQTRNRVLRNTYALLALSMVPTVIGAWPCANHGWHHRQRQQRIGIS